MCKRLEWIAPIFLIAIMVQFFAPIAGGFAMAAASDPLNGAPICSHDSGLPQNPADHTHHSNDCCAFCTQAHATFVPADVPSVPKAQSAERLQLVHNWFSAAPPALRLTRTTRARAPPVFS